MASLSKKSLNRIGRVVRNAERNLPGPPRRGATGIDPTPEFWIKLLDEGTADKVGWYKWSKVYPAPSDPTGWTAAGVDSGADFTARGANGITGLPADTVVRVTFYGFDDDGKPAYFFEDLPGSGEPAGPVRLIVTATNTTTPEIVEAIPYGDPDADVVNVRQIVGHGIGDELYASKPVNGTDLPGIEWREEGPDGLDFPCNVEKVGGNGTLASPYTYHVKIGAFFLTASPVTALRSGAGGTGADAWAPALARAVVPAKYGRARFTGTTPAVELVEAFETRSPVIGVKLEAESLSSSGPPSDTTYTVKDWDDTSITYGTGASPPRMFGDDLSLTDAATYGWGFFNVSGAFTLLAAADEKFTTQDGCAGGGG